MCDNARECEAAKRQGFGRRKRASEVPASDSSGNLAELATPPVPRFIRDAKGR